MTVEELNKFYNDPEMCNIIKGIDLLNKEDRTLAYGYDCDRNTHHVYLQEGIIHLYIYCPRNDLSIHKTENEIENNSEYAPNKRLYPETCDYEFCQKLSDLDVYCPFTTFNHDRPSKKYYGEIFKTKEE